MPSTKERWEHTTKTERIEWTVVSDKAVFYVLRPEYHAHPWVACTAFRSTGEVETYGHTVGPPQAEVLAKALNMAVRWLRGRKLNGKKRDEPAKGDRTVPPGD